MPRIKTTIMVLELKPVDATPICDPADLRRIDPVWGSGHLPPHFWEEVAHRRDYLLWLSHRLGFRGLADFYRLELSPCYGPHGGGSLRAY